MYLKQILTKVQELIQTVLGYHDTDNKGNPEFILTTTDIKPMVIHNWIISQFAKSVYYVWTVVTKTFSSLYLNKQIPGRLFIC